MRAPDQLPAMAIGLKFTAAKRAVGLRAMAKATGMSTGSLSTYLNTGKLPSKCDAQAVQAALRGQLRKAGATATELARLFKPCILATDFAKAKRKGASTLAPAPSHPPAHYHVKKEDLDMLLAKQTLTQAARKHFGLLAGNPFDGEVTTEAEMFQNSDFAYCREAAWTAASQARFVAIVGESGAGKTTLLDDLQERVEAERKPIIIIRPSMLASEDSNDKGKPVKAAGIMDAIIYTLDKSLPPKRTMEAKTRQIQALLEDSAKLGSQHLLLIEEAHSLPATTLKHLKRLHELRMRRKPLIGILLLGQPELAEKLHPSKREVREVSQRIEMFELMPLDGELAGYLRTRMKRCGKPLEDIMDEQAIHAVRERLTVIKEDTKRNKQPISMVYPLAVNNFMTLAMNEATEIGAPKITADLVKGL